MKPPVHGSEVSASTWNCVTCVCVGLYSKDRLVMASTLHAQGPGKSLAGQALQPVKALSFRPSQSVR